MKKIALIALLVTMACSLAMASGSATGNTTYTPTVDIFGAHLNGGRGCAGCHAPHSGARGSGQVYGTGSGVNGDNALWGTDTSKIQTQVLTFDNTYTVDLTTLGGWNGSYLYKGVATCLSCHDGNVSKGAMMTGSSWEQAQGMLNFSVNGSAPLYGSYPIPTLLGNDGSGAGDYNNDHPVGTMANVAKMDIASIVTAGNIVITPPSSNTSTSIKVSVPANGSNYANFAANYGFPALGSLRMNPGDTVVQDAYIVCTTCHNQHNMVVYKASSSKPIAGSTTGTYQTYFFVNGPYNPGAPYDKTHAPSTMQFCRQCHFGESNENYGSYNIGTAF